MIATHITGLDFAIICTLVAMMQFDLQKVLYRKSLKKKALEFGFLLTVKNIGLGREMKTKFASGEKFPCPHCGAIQEFVIDDYAIAGRSGISSKSHEECEFCNKEFTVEKLEKIPSCNESLFLVMK